ncbi:4-hydroxy-3-methylbut-2-enyl diphosphate reductase [Anaerorudis cellulosivorans]|uniref:4-hydroxy-3-methylbut-2-enyl diphosphate reductase n=1 Tax=Anaerorudis cellulosivorans TaxID=3397862 RepID=UPI00221E90A0|nr:4-hydroxy-3-methylbut-2-enyl diphosphate reductase [Seramator thermalis]MCW1735783.1 4-hydroxy-3-methylbut-2-enyl diphosphate reductase [Seramator thermalis]
MLKVEIDQQSGCCFGVERAISKVEEELRKSETLYCLGDIVHNNVEMERLTKMGLVTIDHETFKKLRNVRVLLRAHGEPPETYRIAEENHIEIIDASCPVVLELQKRIKRTYLSKANNEIQLVIYGKKGHAEVNGLLGQTEGSAIVIEKKEDLDKLDFSKDIHLFSQTTNHLEDFREIIDIIQKKMTNDAKFEYHDTICRQVSNRIPHINIFASQHDIIFFIAGEKSSNGKVLFNECKKSNPNSYFIHSPDELDVSLIKDNDRVGICGATSTPKWQMQALAERIMKLKP